MDQKDRNSLCKDIAQSSAMQKEQIGYAHDIQNDQVPIQTNLDLKLYFMNGDMRNEQICPVNVQQIMDAETEQTLPEILMECLLAVHIQNQVQIHNLFIASTFLPKTFLLGTMNPGGIQIFGIADASPSYVHFNQGELEKFYLSYRLPIGKFELLFSSKFVLS